VEEIKEMLIDEKEKILVLMRANMQKNISEHEIGDAIDTSVELQERDFNLLLQDRNNNKLEQIEEALKRIDDEEYGYCQECEEEISKKRLLLIPFTRMCVSCQQAKERLVGGKIISNTLGEAKSFGDD